MLPMNMKASDVNELCDNTVKTHHVNWSDFLKLGFLDKILSKKQFFLFPTIFFNGYRFERETLKHVPPR